MQSTWNEGPLVLPNGMFRRSRTMAADAWVKSEGPKTLRDLDYAVSVLERDEHGSRNDGMALITLGALAVALATVSMANSWLFIACLAVVVLVLVGLLVGQLDALGREDTLRRLDELRRDLTPVREAPIQIARAWGFFRRV